MQDGRFYFDYPSYDTRPGHTLGASFGDGTRSISTFTVLVPSTEAGGVNRGHSTSVRLTEILRNDAALCGTMTASACNLPLTRVVNKGEIRSSNVREEETDHPHCITLAGGSALMCRVVSCLVVDMIGVLTEPMPPSIAPKQSGRDRVSKHRTGQAGGWSKKRSLTRCPEPDAKPSAARRQTSNEKPSRRLSQPLPDYSFGLSVGVYSQGAESNSG